MATQEVGAAQWGQAARGDTTEEVNRLVAQLWKAAPEEAQEKRKQQQSAYQKLMEATPAFDAVNSTSSSQPQSTADKLRRLHSQLEKSWERDERPATTYSNLEQQYSNLGSSSPPSPHSAPSAPAVLEYEAMLKERLAQRSNPTGTPEEVPSKPASASATTIKAANVYNRTEMWRQNKQNQLNDLRQQRLDEEEAKCSFRPAINKTSSVNPKVQNTNVVNRLYQAKKNTESNIEVERRKRQDEESEACTFQPALNRNAWTDHVEPRYLSGNNTSASTASSRRSLAYTGEECTFQPRINDYYPTTAQGYLEVDAFERLSAPATKNDNEKKHDKRWFMEDSDLQNGRRQKQDEDEFLLRMKEHEHRRLEKLEYLKETDPSNFDFKPDINKKSRDLVDRRGSADFFERLATDQQLREAKGKRMAAMQRQGQVDEECSFKPTITPSARSLRPRTAEELSYGDMERKEERRKRGARERYEKELDDCTFAPALSGANVNIKSKVSVKTDPMGYIQWAKAKNQQRTQYVELEKKKKDEEVMKSCTFRPKIHQAPGYISTIAASVSLAKSPTGSRKSSKASSHTFGYD